MSNLSPERGAALRHPALLFGPIAVVLLFLAALICASLINTGLSGDTPVAARGLFTPAVIGLGLCVAALGPRARRGEITSRIAIIRRAALSFAIAGFVWPLSFGIAIALQGDMASALAALIPALFGLAIGAVSGAVGGVAAAYACFARA
jgi:hypothetical protein